jgi:DNA-binding NarL/FixJ family response regulator
MSDLTYIAIVDDHTMFRKGLAALIDFFPNYKVLFDVSNGKEFIDKLDKKQLPRIVLLDIAMPEMDGYTTAAWIRDNCPEIKILALSTMDSEAAIIKMIKNGARGYILKDSDPSELKLAFDEVLSLGYFYNELVSRKVVSAVHFLSEKNSTATFVNLTPREMEFLKYACTELTYKEIANEMGVSTRTVEGYRDALCEKLGLKTRIGLAMYAVKHKIADIA